MKKTIFLIFAAAFLFMFALPARSSAYVPQSDGATYDAGSDDNNGPVQGDDFDGGGGDDGYTTPGDPDDQPDDSHGTPH